MQGSKDLQNGGRQNGADAEDKVEHEKKDSTLKVPTQRSTLSSKVGMTNLKIDKLSDTDEEDVKELGGQ